MQKIIKLYLLDFLADSHPVLMADFFLWWPGGYFAAFAAVVPAAHFLSSRLVNSMTQDEIHDRNNKVRNVPVTARYLHSDSRMWSRSPCITVTVPYDRPVTLRSDDRDVSRLITGPTHPCGISVMYHYCNKLAV